MLKENKLYVNVNCTICLGRNATFCPYCRPSGWTFIEASDKVIADWLKTLDKERLEAILEKVKVENEKS